MSESRFCVDFNEMLDANRVLFSAEDERLDSLGRKVAVQAGMVVVVYMDDVDDLGKKDNLVARGLVEINTSTGWAKHVKWCCRIDSDGIRHESELKND
jgi:hypothetical protein